MKRSWFILCILGGIRFSLLAQPAAQADTTRVSYLNEVVISANKIPELRKTVAQQVQVITTATIRFLNAQTSADLISNTGYVFMQKSQQGGGSPTLRGFEASRVLLMIDGVRMNNAIYRSGHLQNIITIDNNMLERAEVLFGPSSTVYGSDALGGVVLFFTRSPQLAADGQSRIFSGNSFLRYSSANREKTGNLNFNIGGKKFSSFTSLTYSDFGDLRMGKNINPSLGEPFWLRSRYVVRSADNTTDEVVNNPDPYVQKLSGYAQYDLTQKFLLKTSEQVSHLLNIQYSNSSNVPRYDRLTDTANGNLRFAEWYYGPQKRLLTAYRLQVADVGNFADAMTTTVSYQDIEESRYDRRVGNNNRNERIEKVDVVGLTVDFNKIKGKNNFRYGIDGQFNRVNSTARRVNIANGTVSPQSTRYPDGDNRMDQVAVYGTHTLQLNDKWTLNNGVRIGGSWLHSTFINKDFFPFPFDEITQNYLTYSGNLGIIYAPGTWKISLLASSGFRAPNIDDLAKVFDSQPGAVIVPNPELTAEKTVNVDLGITKFIGSRFLLEGVLFGTNFTDAIVIRPSTFNGQLQIIYDGVLSNVFTATNKGRAYLYGYTLGLRADITQRIGFAASYNYTHGRVKNDDGSEDPLDHIPPAFGRMGMQYNTTRFKAELFSNFSGWKRVEDYSPSGEDNLHYAAPQGMPSWYTINLRTSYDVIERVTVQFGIDNILDLQYRTFSSGINAPGRNFSFTARVQI